MSNKKYFSYIRVSTQRQGQHGTSLAEQQASIEHFSQTWNFQIIKRFEERETAAKQGRPVFLEMLKQVRQGKAQGVIIHKIDRSARNLKDWADLGALIDAGIEVHFASESLDINSRGGRLSADIQAVVASDYIRNLREETKKGIYGRLKQGLFPFRAMTGYLNRGSGQPKVIDPITGPLVRKAFELYASGDWGLTALNERMRKLGLRSRNGTRISRNGLSTILHSPFYIGVITIKKTGQTFAGVHKPLISKALFDQVQGVFSNKNFNTAKRHFFVYRRMIECKGCGHLMTPETQKKKFIYYRCHTRNCTPGCLRGDTITRKLTSLLKKISFSEDEYRLLKKLSQTEAAHIIEETQAARAEVELRQSHLKDRHSRLADAYVDGVFDEATYLQKKNELVLEEAELREKLAGLQFDESQIAARLDDFFELANSAYLSYKLADPTTRRDLLKTLVSNITSDGKTVSIKLKMPFQIVAHREGIPLGCPDRAGFRTLSALVSQLWKVFAELRLQEPNTDLGLEP